MQTKRKQTLLAGAGLLTALTLSMAGCTPSKFTPGMPPTAPNTAAPSTPSNTANAVAVDLSAKLAGAPMKDAEVRVYNALTGAPAMVTAGVANIIATGGGNLNAKATAAVAAKTDANGLVSLNLSGLTGSNVAKVVVTSGGKSVTTLVDASGNLAGAGFAVAQAGLRVVVTADEVTTVQTAIANEILKMVGALKNDGERTSTIAKLVKDLKAMTAGIKSQLESNPVARQAVTENVTLSGDVAKPTEFDSMLKAAGLTDEITAAVQEVAKVMAAAAATNALLGGSAVNISSTNFVGLDTPVTISPTGELAIGDTKVDLSDNVTTDPTPTQPNQPVPEVPIVQLEPPAPEDPDKVPGEWEGFKPDFSITDVDTNSDSTNDTTKASVTQPGGESHYTFMEMLIPTASLSGYSASTFEGLLEGDVTGTLTNGTTSRVGPIEFSGNKIWFNGTQQIGQYSITTVGSTLKVTMRYNNASDAITTVGNHTTNVWAKGVKLTTRTNLYVSLATADGKFAFTTF